MSMSRKDFELLARTIKDARESQPFFGGKEPLVDELAKRVGRALDRHSSAFQLSRFLKACGVPE